jgi:hypothetical protein
MPDICPDFDAVPSALGILVCERQSDPPFAESAFLRRLMKTGSLAGLLVFAFAPWSWSPVDASVTGWTWDEEKGVWQSRRRPLPKLVYDRSWPADRRERSRYRLALLKIGDRERLIHLNGKLPHKGHVYALLARDERLAELLPPTETYTGSETLGAWLDRNDGAAFLKPAQGSQGRRVVAYVRHPNESVTLQGRYRDNRPFSVTLGSSSEAMGRLNRWIGERNYLMQPLLDLRGPDGEPFDVRALVQRNGRRRWTLTGVAVRSGLPGTVTANLHGGGQAAPAEERLTPMFGRLHTEELLQQIHDSCRDLVRQLEHHYGRFAELGLDFGIDRSGRLWFLEANSKPGRTAMTGIGASAARAAAERPIAYARAILLRPHGRVIHEFDHL